MTDKVDRAAMRLAERLREELWMQRRHGGGVKDHHIAAALLDLGLREAVLQVECGREADAVSGPCPYCERAYTALLGEKSSTK